MIALLVILLMNIILSKDIFTKKLWNILFMAIKMPSKRYIECINDQFENINDDRINGCIWRCKNFNHQ
jgi:hypothetical protein